MNPKWLADEKPHELDTLMRIHGGSSIKLYQTPQLGPDQNNS